MHKWLGPLADDSAAAILYFALAAALMGCEQRPATPLSGTLPSEGDVIALIGPARPSAQWVGITGGARRFAESFPVLRLKTIAPSDNSAIAMSQLAAAALADKARVICLYVSDPVVARPAINRILAGTTILVTMGVDSDVPGVFGHVYVDTPGGAELLARHLPEIAGGKRSYLLLHRHETTPSDTRCYERFMQQMRMQYGMTLLEERNAGRAEQSPAELLRAMFARFRHAGLAVTLDPTAWLSGLPEEVLGGEARFATLGAAPALWPYLQSGQAAALVGPLDGEIGSLAMEFALAGITESRGPGQVRIVDYELVTPDTLDDFARRYAEAAGFELDELLPAGTSSRPAGPSDAQAKP